MKVSLVLGEAGYGLMVNGGKDREVIRKEGVVGRVIGGRDVISTEPKSIQKETQQHTENESITEIKPR